MKHNISQIDGFKDSAQEESKYPDVQDKISQIEVVTEKEAEVQTKPSDLTVHFSDSDKTILAPGTVFLIYKVEQIIIIMKGSW